MSDPQQKQTPAPEVQAQLDLLSPPATPPARQARARFESRYVRQQPGLWHRLFQPQQRLAWLSALFVAALAIALSFPQVRAVANSFLGLFRVERVEAVNVGISLDDLPDLLEQNFVALDSVLAQDVAIHTTGTARTLASTSAARSAVDFSPRFSSYYPAEPQLVFQPAASVELTIDRERWQLLLESLGYGDFAIPANADGETITIQVPETLVAGYGDCTVTAAHEIQAASESQDCTIFLQSSTPSITAPAGLDIHQAGQVLLQALGMSPEEAAAFSARIDWSTTLVVPVPRDAGFQELAVDGVQGIFLTGLDHQGAEDVPFYTLLWVKDGVFYALTGPGELDDALAVVQGLE